MPASSEYTGQDIYCDLIVPGKLEVQMVKETPRVMAFRHTRPGWPVHIVVTPKRHITSLLELPAEPSLLQEYMAVVADVAREVNTAEGKCRVITNLGEYQDSKHLHFHIVSGQRY